MSESQLREELHYLISQHLEGINSLRATARATEEILKRLGSTLPPRARSIIAEYDAIVAKEHANLLEQQPAAPTIHHGY